MKHPCEHFCDGRCGALSLSVSNAYCAEACTVDDRASSKDIQAWVILTTPSRGLGDTISKVTAAIGIKPCVGCKKRAAALNNLVPYSPAST